jgi:Protoglobin
MHRIADRIPGYTFGEVAPSPITLEELEQLKRTVGFSEEDQRYLRQAGEVLKEQASAVVLHWRSQIIAGIPHLARHSRTPEGAPNPEYLGQSNLRFTQWILDTCFRAYDQEWLNYQQEIALRHTSAKKNQTDGVRSTPFVPLRDVIGFVPVMNETIKPYLAAGGAASEEVERMHLAWCKSMQLQIALWSRAYAEPGQAASEW